MKRLQMFSLQVLMNANDFKIIEKQFTAQEIFVLYHALRESTTQAGPIVMDVDKKTTIQVIQRSKDTLKPNELNSLIGKVDSLTEEELFALGIVFSDARRPDNEISPMDLEEILTTPIKVVVTPG